MRSWTRRSPVGHRAHRVERRRARARAAGRREGRSAVLLLDGEELVGAKQNRVLNLTILAPAQRTTVVPVSCVESGRWRHVSRGFSSAPRAQFAEGRAAKMRQVTASLLSTGERRSDQGAVWDLIAEKAERLEARSDTSAMSAMFEKLTGRSRTSSAAFSQSTVRSALCFSSTVRRSDLSCSTRRPPGGSCRRSW